MSRPRLSLKAIFKLLAPFLLIAFFCICLTPHELQNDTYYLVKIGDRIINHGLDFKDHYTWLADLSYTYPHFLFNLICFAFYVLLGWNGLYILSILLYILLGSSLFVCLRLELKLFLKNHTSLSPSTKSFVNLLPLLLSLLSVIFLPSFITARSQVLTYTAFIWEFYCLSRLVETRNKKYIFAVSALSLLVALTHATIWPFVFILFLPFTAELFIQKFFVNSETRKARKLLTSLAEKFIPLSPYKKGTAKTLLFAALGALAAGLLTPSRICYTAIFKIMQGSSQSYIFEHAPLVLRNLPEAAIIFLIFLVLLVFTKSKLRPRDFFLTAGLTVLAFLSVRHVSFLLTVAFLPLFSLLLDWATLVNPKFFEGVLKFTPARLILTVCMILAMFSFVEQLRKPLNNPELAPSGAVAFLKSNYPELENLDLNSSRASDLESPVRLFNEYNIGAYLLNEDIPVSIDSRANIYTKPFSPNLESDLFDDYETILKGSEEGFELIEKYELKTFLLYKTTSLARVLAHDEAYKELYSDDSFVIFEKSSVPVSE